MKDPLPAVLILEDEAVVLDILGCMAEALGRRAVLFKTGAEALAWLSEFPEEADVAVVDIILTQSDGFAFAHALEKMQPGIRIVLMSGYPESHFASRGDRSWAWRYLEKPITLASFREVLGAGRQMP